MKTLPPLPSGKIRRWWFGDTRTLEQQISGLEMLMDSIKGKTVLDIGCAEGAITIECAKRGARQAYGIDVVPEYIEKAREEAWRHRSPCLFITTDVTIFDFAPDESYDVILLLAILQKVPDPSGLAKRVAKHAHDMVVIRLPPGDAPVVIDQRSGMQPHDIEYAMREAGFFLIAQADGPVAEAGVPEQTLYFRRSAHG